MTLSKLHQPNDLNALDIRAFANAGAWMEVKHPISNENLVNEAGQPWRVLLAGKDSFTYRSASSEAIQRRVAEAVRVTPEILERERVSVLHQCVLNWENFVKDGADFPCTPANAEHMVENYPWFGEQIENFILSREQYFLANTKP